MAIDGHDNSENIRKNAGNISNLQKEISFEFNSSTLEMLDRQLKVRNYRLHEGRMIGVNEGN